MGPFVDVWSEQKRVTAGILVFLLFTVHFSQSEDTYNPVGKGYNCKKCEAGHYLVKHCHKGQPHTTQCSLCPAGTYNSGYSIATYCTTCTPDPCHWPQVVTRACTTKSDTLCGCVQGYYHDDGVCIPHSKCDKGLGVAKLGTPRSDTDCQPCQVGFYSNVYSATKICKVRTNCREKRLDIKTLGDREHDNLCSPKSSPRSVTKPSQSSSLFARKTAIIPKTTTTGQVIKERRSEDKKSSTIIVGTLAAVVAGFIVLVVFLVKCVRKNRNSSETGFHQVSGEEATKENMVLYDVQHKKNNIGKCPLILPNHPPRLHNYGKPTLKIKYTCKMSTEVALNVHSSTNVNNVDTANERDPEIAENVGLPLVTLATPHPTDIVPHQEENIQTASATNIPSHTAHMHSYRQEDETMPKQALAQNDDDLWIHIFQIIAMNVGNSWRKFLRNLRDHLTESKIDYLLEDYQRAGTQEMILQALRQWKEKACNPTFTDIINSLVATDKCNIAEEIEQYLQCEQ